MVVPLTEMGKLGKNRFEEKRKRTGFNFLDLLNLRHSSGNQRERPHQGDRLWDVEHRDKFLFKSVC